MFQLRLLLAIKGKFAECKRSTNIQDPHTTCFSHNKVCWMNFSFIPERCPACMTIIDSYKAGSVVMKGVFNERITAMHKAFRKAFSDNRISDPAILERAAKSECRDVFAPKSRCWDPRPRSGSVPFLDILSHTSEADLTPARQEVPADPSPPLSLPLPSPPRALSPVPGPSGIQNPPRREPSPESRHSGKHSRPASPSSSASASPSPPSKKKKSRDSSDKCEILAEMARMHQDFVASLGSVQSRLTALESPARIVQPVEREEVMDEEDGSGHSGSDHGSSRQKTPSLTRWTAILIIHRWTFARLMRLLPPLPLLPPSHLIPSRKTARKSSSSSLKKLALLTTTFSTVDTSFPLTAVKWSAKEFKHKRPLPPSYSLRLFVFCWTDQNWSNHPLKLHPLPVET